MSLQVNCDRCHEELMEKGAIILSPPKIVDGGDVVQKYHLCVKCFEWLLRITTERPEQKKKADKPIGS